jgi:hypothetical protein
MSHCTLDLLKRNPVMQHSLFCLSFHCGTIVDSAGKHRGSLLYVYVHVYRAGTRLDEMQLSAIQDKQGKLREISSASF